MNVRTSIGLGVVALVALGAVGYGAWTAGMRSGMEMGSPPSSPSTASAPQNPVSYTHLDVYKRQLLERVDALHVQIL